MGNDVENTGTLTSAARPIGGAVAAVIVAAGRGERAGQGQGPKQYRAVGGEAILARTLRAFVAHEAIARIVLVIHPDDDRMLAAACGDISPQVEIAHGGKTRQESVRLGLHRLADDPPTSVLIQDGVRPFTDVALIDRVLAELDGRSAVLPAVPVAETLKREAADGTVFETVPRDGLHAAQTPQAFPFQPILAAHDKAHGEGRDDFTDDAGIAEWVGIPVRLVPGSPDNVKITWQRDIELADLRLRRQSGYPDVRAGNGYDVHAFTEGESVVLCGVAIPHDRKLLGHSDADVGLHALTDALLATCGAGDIGTHFPPSDPQWRGAASRVFVEHAAAIVRSRGGRIANADVTLIAEAPKIGPHRAAMTESLASMLRIDTDRVSVKATTNERLGFIGRAEGIAAIATTTVVYPGELPE